mmetsp:Transcript_118047/g.270782  ORF Transcript_118047/g.270782 Transcript_118047/m.270782 type:complete len:364 (-) Transcript_118047:488-1579(-)
MGPLHWVPVGIHEHSATGRAQIVRTLVQVPDTSRGQSASHSPQIRQGPRRRVHLNDAPLHGKMPGDAGNQHRPKGPGSQGAAGGSNTQAPAVDEILPPPDLSHCPGARLLHISLHIRIVRLVEGSPDQELIPVGPQLACMAKEHLVPHELKAGRRGLRGGESCQDAIPVVILSGGHGMFLGAFTPGGWRLLGRGKQQARAVASNARRVPAITLLGNDFVQGPIHCLHFHGVRKDTSAVSHPLHSKIGTIDNPAGNLPSNRKFKLRITVDVGDTQNVKDPGVAPVGADQQLVVCPGLHDLVKDQHNRSSLVGHVGHPPRASLKLTVGDEAGRRERRHDVQGGRGKIVHALHGHITPRRGSVHKI